MCWAPGIEWIKETASSPGGSPFQRGADVRMRISECAHGAETYSPAEGRKCHGKKELSLGQVTGDACGQSCWKPLFTSRTWEWWDEASVPPAANPVPGDHDKRTWGAWTSRPTPWVTVGGGPVQGPEAEDGFPVETLVGGLGADVRCCEALSWRCSAPGTWAAWTCRGTTSATRGSGRCAPLSRAPLLYSISCRTWQYPAPSSSCSRRLSSAGRTWWWTAAVLLGQRWHRWPVLVEKLRLRHLPTRPARAPSEEPGKPSVSSGRAVPKDSSAGVGHEVQWSQGPHCGDPGAADLLHLPRM